jgi:hypothetical protein
MGLSLSLNWNEAMKDVFAKCFKKTAVQVCAEIICICHLVKVLVFIFRRLKINHDSHEFNLESGTVSNNYFQVWKAAGN